MLEPLVPTLAASEVMKSPGGSSMMTNVRNETRKSVGIIAKRRRRMKAVISFADE
jgi:hypothetical protein